jgi:hypothetical protein
MLSHGGSRMDRYSCAAMVLLPLVLGPVLVLIRFLEHPSTGNFCWLAVIVGLVIVFGMLLRWYKRAVETRLKNER